MARRRLTWYESSSEYGLPATMGCSAIKAIPVVLHPPPSRTSAASVLLENSRAPILGQADESAKTYVIDKTVYLSDLDGTTPSSNPSATTGRSPRTPTPSI